MSLSSAQALADLLLPGDGATGWPSASAALPQLGEVFSSLPAGYGAAIAELAMEVAKAGPEAGVALVESFERAAPKPFAALRDGLYEAYYATPAVQARVAELANGAPREPDMGFDPTLLTQVTARQAGLRRL